MFWSSKYRKDPKVTSDRKPPDFFMEELKKLDPLLRVEWWNVGITPVIGPSFRLIRVLPDGRWAHVDWFKMATMSYIRYLRSIDTHYSGDGNVSADQDKLRRELWKEYRREEAERQYITNERAGVMRDEVCEDFDRMQDRFYSYSK